MYILIYVCILHIYIYICIYIESQLKMIQDVKVQNQKRRIEAAESDLQSKVNIYVFVRILYIMAYISISVYLNRHINI
jgi:hypothetical protein